MTPRNTTPRPVTDDERAAVARLAADGWSRNAIARHLRRSCGLVSRLAAEQGITFDRTATAAATAARRADAEATRVELGCTLLEAAEDQAARLAEITDDHARLAAAKAVSSLVAAYSRLAALDAARDDDRDHADVDMWLTHLAGEPPAHMLTSENEPYTLD